MFNEPPSLTENLVVFGDRGRPRTRRPAPVKGRPAFEAHNPSPATSALLETRQRPLAHRANRPSGDLLVSNSTNFLNPGAMMGTDSAREFFRRSPGPAGADRPDPEKIAHAAKGNWIQALFS